MTEFLLIDICLIVHIIFCKKVRSPEEYAERWLDEKIDIYSFGNILFTLLTGKEPYEDLLYYPSEYAKRVTSGNPPRVGLKIRGNSFAEAALAAIMD